MRTSRFVAPSLLVLFTLSTFLACGSSSTSAAPSGADSPDSGASEDDDAGTTTAGDSGGDSGGHPAKDGGGGGCSAPKAICGGNCVDTSTDPLHCGGCATVCPSSSCKASKCAEASTRWFKYFEGDVPTYRASATAIDAAGNVYFTGSFVNTADFGGGLVTGNGHGDVFVVSYTAAGTYRWAKHFGATDINGAGASAMTTDAKGNIFVTGGFHGSIDFGGGALDSAGASDGYVVELSASTGDYETAWRFGSTALDTSVGIGVDSDGNVSVCGDFDGPKIDFGGGVTLAGGASANQNAYVIGFDGSGNHRWSKRLSGETGFNRCRALTMGANGLVVVAGDFGDSADLGAGTVVSAGQNDAFVAGFTSAGAPSFSRRIGGVGNERAEGVALDSAGNIFLIGTFNGDVDFGLGVLPAQFNQAFVASFSPSANTTRFARSFEVLARSVSVDPSGDVVFGGSISADTDFGKGTLTLLGKDDVFIARFANADGVTQFAHRYGGTDYDEVNGVAVGADHAIAIAGTFVGNVDFGTGAVDGSLQSNGFMMLFDP